MERPIIVASNTKLWWSCFCAEGFFRRDVIWESRNGCRRLLRRLESISSQQSKIITLYISTSHQLKRFLRLYCRPVAPSDVASSESAKKQPLRRWQKSGLTFLSSDRNTRREESGRPTDAVTVDGSSSTICKNNDVKALKANGLCLVICLSRIYLFTAEVVRGSEFYLRILQ